MIVKTIRFIFENTDSVEFPTNVLGDVYIRKLETGIARVAMNAIDKGTIAREIAIEIFSKGNHDYHPFKTDDCTSKVFDRILTCGDITSLEIVYKDDSEETIYTDFDGEEENKYQTSILSSLGNLYITIGKGDLMEEYFPEKEREDKMNIGIKTMMYS